MTRARGGPVVIGFDGTPASELAIRETGDLLAGHSALVVVVWYRGVGIEVVQVPPGPIGLEQPIVDVHQAVELDEAMFERAQKLAQRGAQLATDAGLEAESMAAADQLHTPVAETLLRVARDRDAEAVVVGAHNKGRLAEVLLGSTARDVVRHADRPVIVVREAG
jgi:nucleotide-binding universal stress UspA family protein